MCSDRAKTDTGRLIGVVLGIDIITKLNTIARILQCGVPKGDGPKGALRLVGFATKLSLISVLCVRSGKH